MNLNQNDTPNFAFCVLSIYDSYILLGHFELQTVGTSHDVEAD